MNVENDGIIYRIKKNNGEVNNVYYDRIQSIIKEKPKNKINLEKVKKQIMFEINKKHLKCVY
jgi:hypothetical protein